MKKRYSARLAYDGRGFSGFQRQDNAPSVQQAVEEVLSTIFGEPISIVGCGRTDAGVHARDYYCHFDTSFDVPVTRIHNINGLLGDRIAIKSIVEVADSFHARFDALERSYEYRIHTHKNPFLKDWSFHLRLGQGNIDRSLLKHSASLLLDFDDFNTFCKTHTDTETTRCELSRSEWIFEEERMIYHISADRFLRGMVRLIVGAMINVARGKISKDELNQALESKMRLATDWSVPAHGLFLTRVIYPQSANDRI